MRENNKATKEIKVDNDPRPWTYENPDGLR